MSSFTEACFRTLFQTSMVKSVLALLKMESRSLINAAIITAIIRPFKPTNINKTEVQLLCNLFLNFCIQTSFTSNVGCTWLKLAHYKWHLGCRGANCAECKIILKSICSCLFCIFYLRVIKIKADPQMDMT